MNHRILLLCIVPGFVLLTTPGCQATPRGTASREGVFDAPAVTIANDAPDDVGPRAYAAYATAVVLHQRSDRLLLDASGRNEDAPDLTVEQRLAARKEAEQLWTEAVQKYGEALAADPKSVDAQSNLARGYFDRGDSTRGYLWLKKALQQVPDDFMLLYRLGMRCENDRQVDEAIDAFRKAAEAPVSAEKLRLLPLVILKFGGLYETRGKLAEATEAYRAFIALKKEPDDVYGENPALIDLMNNRAPVWRKLGEVYARMAKYAESSAAWREAYRLQPEVTQSLIQIALVWRDAGDSAQALASCAEYVDVMTRRLHEEEQADRLGTADLDDQRIARARYRRTQRDLLRGLRLFVDICAKQYNIADPIAAAERAAGEHPRVYQINLLIASLYFESGKPDKAAEAYWRIAEERKPLLPAYISLIDLELSRERYDKALAAVSAGLASGSSDRMLPAQLGLVIEEAAKVEDIEKKFTDAVGPTHHDFAYYYVFGRLQEEMKKREEAKTSFGEALKLNPKFTEGYVALGSILFVDEKKPAEALALLQTAEKNLGDDPVILRFTAEVQQDMKDYAGAVKTLEKVVALSPDDRTATLSLAGAMQKAGRGEEAATMLDRRLAAADSENAQDWIVTVAAYHLQFSRDFDRAAGVLISGTDRFGESERLWRFLGDVQRRRKAYGEAAEAFRRAAELDPRDLATRSFLALMLEKGDRLDEAEKTLRRAVRDFPEEEDTATLELARFLVRTRRNVDEGLAMLTKAVNDDPESIEARMALGFAYLRLKRFKDAVDVYEGLLKDYPESISVRYQLAMAYDESDRFDEAEKALKWCLEKDPDDDVAANALGYMYADRSMKLDEAKKLVEQALEAEPENGAYLDSMGWVYYRQGDLQKAREYLEKAVDREDDPVVLDHLGDVYFKLGRRDEARKLWERAAKTDVNKETEAAVKLERLKAGEDPFGAQK